jgi:hypothetical protein
MRRQAVFLCDQPARVPTRLSGFVIIRLPEALRVFTKAEIEKWLPIIKATNIKGE